MPLSVISNMGVGAFISESKWSRSSRERILSKGGGRLFSVLS